MIAGILGLCPPPLLDLPNRVSEGTTGWARETRSLWTEENVLSL